MEVVRGLLFLDPPRIDQLVVHLWGADILSDDPTSIPAWSLVSREFRDIVLTASNDQKQRMIDPEGLSTSYVWCKAGNWVQEVSETDVEVIRNSDARTWFRDPERFGPFTPINAFAFPVVETVPINGADDLRQFRRDQRRKTVWTGR